MSSPTASSLVISGSIPSARLESRSIKRSKVNCSLALRVKPQVLHPKPFGGRRNGREDVRNRSALLICAATLSATCSGASQTQTVERPTSTITVAPTSGKEKSPELDDGGTGFPPRDDGDGGGGGGGGGGGWAGGFFFFGFLAFLGLLKDQEEDGPYRSSRSSR